MTTWASRVLANARVIPEPPPPTEHRCDQCGPSCDWHLHHCQRKMDIDTVQGFTQYCDCPGTLEEK